jgi:hypothetical protein
VLHEKLMIKLHKLHLKVVSFLVSTTNRVFTGSNEGLGQQQVLYQGKVGSFLLFVLITSSLKRIYEFTRSQVPATCVCEILNPP